VPEDARQADRGQDGTVTGLIVSDERGKERRVAAKSVVCNADLGQMIGTLLADAPIADKLEAQVGRLRLACSRVGQHQIRGRFDHRPIHVAAPDGHAGLVIPSAVDPTCAPEGYATLEILQLLTNDEARSWLPDGVEGNPARLAEYRRTDAYIARKRAMGDKLIARAKLAIPDVDERIVYRAELSPVTFHRYSWTSDGAIYGTKAARGPIPTKTPLRNLVIAGAATHGAGVEAVVISGAYAAASLLPGVLRSQRMGEAA
jgi:hypothetical protein